MLGYIAHAVQTVSQNITYTVAMIKNYMVQFITAHYTFTCQLSVYIHRRHHITNQPSSRTVSSVSRLAMLCLSHHCSSHSPQTPLEHWQLNSNTTALYHGLCSSNKLLYKQWENANFDPPLTAPTLLTDRPETQI